MKKTATIILICTISIVLIYGIFSLTIFDTAAKYTNYKEMNHYYESNKLYISSNSLIEQDGKYNIINYYNYEQVEIEIQNSISENQITNYDIDYQLTCNVLGDESNYYSCLFDSNENNITSTLKEKGKCIEDENLSYKECIENEYNYQLDIVKHKHNFKIKKLKENNYDKIEVEVNLNTTSPFNKNLKAIYVLNFGSNNKNTIHIENIKDYDSFCEYTISNNYNNDKNVKINIDTNKFIFDNDINKISYTNTYEGIIDSITIKINKQNNQKIRLYKKNFNTDCDKNNLNYTVE